MLCTYPLKQLNMSNGRDRGYQIKGNRLTSWLMRVKGSELLVEDNEGNTIWATQWHGDFFDPFAWKLEYSAAIDSMLPRRLEAGDEWKD